MAERIEVDQFLQDFKVKMEIWGLYFRQDRIDDKNQKTLLELGYNYSHIKEVLRELTLVDYCEGPLQDQLYNIAPMWVFGMVIAGKEIYIKIQMGNPSNQVICISFHFAEFNMKYPFKT